MSLEALMFGKGRMSWVCYVVQDRYVEHLRVSSLGLVRVFVPVSAKLQNTSGKRPGIVNLAVQTLNNLSIWPQSVMIP